MAAATSTTAATTATPTAATPRAAAETTPALPSPLPREDRAGLTARLATHFDALRPTVHRPPAGILSAPWTTPGGYYNQLWDWDGFFIGVHLAHEGEPEHLVHLVTKYVCGLGVGVGARQLPDKGEHLLGRRGISGGRRLIAFIASARGRLCL